MLPLAARDGEAQVDIFDVVVGNHLDYVSYGGHSTIPLLRDVTCL
jgi:hypothetical protein